MANRRKKKQSTAFLVVVVALVLIIAVAAIVIYFVKPELYHKYLGFGDHTWTEYETVTANTCGKDGKKSRYCTVCEEVDEVVIPKTGNHSLNSEQRCTVCGYDASSPIGDLTGVASSDLSIHFIKFDNDKAGDCTLIKCGNTEVLIDAGSTQASASTIKSYLSQYVTDNKLEYVIATHADQDHIAAFVGNSKNGNYDGILYSYEIGTIIKFDRTNKELKTDKGNDTLYGKFEQAVSYAVSHGAKAFTGGQCYKEATVEGNKASKTYYLDTQNKISMNILNNYYYDHNSTDENNYSVCMLLKQEIATNEYRNYLFTGDLEEKGEEYLVQLNDLPEVDLFKAGHHGSPTSSNNCLLEVIKPKYVAVCCCAGTDEYTQNKENQFPSQAMINRVAPYTDKVFVTNMISENTAGYEPMNGNIVFYTENGKLKYYCSNSNKTLREWDWFKDNRTCPDAWKEKDAA